MKKIVVCLLGILILITAQSPIFAADQDNSLLLRFDLNFFNQNQDGSLFAAFQRNHMLTVESHLHSFDFTFTYNWLEKVNGEYTLHDMTPLGGSITYNVDPNRQISLTYIEVTDLYHLNRDSNVWRMDYDYQLLDSDILTLQTRMSARYLNQQRFVPVFGGLLKLFRYYHIGINYLNPMDDHILDERDMVIDLPANIGFEIPFNENVRLRVDAYCFINKPPYGYQTWYKTQFQFDLWKFILRKPKQQQ